MGKNDDFLGQSLRIPPSNISAEQALLGAILTNNKAYDKVCGFLDSSHFADPINAAIYKAVARRRNANQVADPIVLYNEFKGTGVLDDVGGPQYLADLLSAMTGILNAADYGMAIRDAWLRRQIIEVGEEMINEAFGAQIGVDADALLIDAQERMHKISGSKADQLRVTIGDATQNVVNQMGEAAAGRPPVIYSTGLPPVDDIIGGGMRPEQLIVIGGRPGHGKTSLGLQIVLLVAEAHGFPILIHSLEMSADELGARAIAFYSKVPAWRIEAGRVSPAEADRVVEAQRRFNSLQIEIDDRAGIGMQEIRASIRRFRQKYKGIGLLVIDHMHLVRPEREAMKSMGLVYSVGKISEDAKVIAKEEKIPVLLLAQLSRNKESSEDKVPTLGDLRNSGDIEANADTVIFVHRPELHLHKSKPTRKPNESDSEYLSREQAYYQMVTELAGKATVLSSKARKGRTGAAEMLYDGETTSFRCID